jgi:hypothetical protein
MLAWLHPVCQWWWRRRRPPAPTLDEAPSRGYGRMRGEDLLIRDVGRRARHGEEASGGEDMEAETKEAFRLLYCHRARGTWTWHVTVCMCVWGLRAAEDVQTWSMDRL